MYFYVGFNIGVINIKDSNVKTIKSKSFHKLKFDRTIYNINKILNIYKINNM